MSGSLGQSTGLELPCIQLQCDLKRFLVTPDPSNPQSSTMVMIPRQLLWWHSQHWTLGWAKSCKYLVGRLTTTCNLNLSPGQGTRNGGRISRRCFWGQELHLEQLICPSHRTEPLVLAKATCISHGCYWEISTHVFPGDFRRYNSIFTYSSLFKAYIFFSSDPSTNSI